MSPIELTEEQRRLIAAEPGPPIDVIDPATSRAYVLIAREQYERVSALLAAGPRPEAGAAESAADLIPPGILRAQRAFWRDLPALLCDARNRGRWVCYHGDERISAARTQRELVRECLRRGLPDDAYYTAVVEPRDRAPWEVEEVESLGPHHLADPDDA